MLPYVLNVPIIKAGQAKEITPIGCGPYMFSEDGNSLVAFDEYKKRDTLPFDIIELKEYETIEERIDAFEDGEVNLVVNDRTGKNSLGYGGKNEIRYFTTLNLHYFGFNMADEFVSKPGVRYAMQFALNREEAAKVFLNNNALPTVAAVHPRSELYSQDLARSVNYNMDSCLTSFNNAGVTDADNDGKLENMMYGIPVEINVDLIVCADGAGKGDIARKFAKELSTIGVTVSVRELSWQDYNTALQEGEFDMYYAEVRIPGDFNIQNMFEEEGSLNFGKILDDELIYVIDDFLAAGDDTRADKCYNMMNVFLNKSPIIPICFERRELIMHRILSRCGSLRRKRVLRSCKLADTLRIKEELMTDRELMDIARRASEKAYAPYSRFRSEQRWKLKAGRYLQGAMWKMRLWVQRYVLKEQLPLRLFPKDIQNLSE